MIPKRKKQLSSPHLLASLLAIPLVAFFIYAIVFHNAFFAPLIVILGLIFVVLVFFRLRLVKKQAEIGLRRQDLREKVNLLEGELAKERQAITAYEKKITNYSYLKKVTEQLCLCFTLDETVRTLSHEVDQLFGRQEIQTLVYLFHSRTGELGLCSSLKGRKKVKVKEKQGDVYDRWVVKTLKSLLVEDAKKDFRFDLDAVTEGSSRSVRSLMSVPMMTGNKVIGILRVDSPREDRFSSGDIRLLSTIADLGAIAIENTQLYEQIEHLAAHDSLTGLSLRRFFMRALSLEVSRELRKQEDLSFLMVDLDRFKQYNDRFGHTAGDILLRAVGRILSRMFQGPGQLVCRYGGEEFAVALPNCPKAKAVALAEDFRRFVEKETIVLRREKTHITVSVGVASVPEDARVKEELIQRADEALYRAKAKGRNRVCAA